MFLLCSLPIVRERCESANQPFRSEFLKRCPDCAELIQSNARICAHCRRTFSAQEVDVHYRTRLIGAGVMAAIFLFGAVQLSRLSDDQDRTNMPALAPQIEAQPSARENTDRGRFSLAEARDLLALPRLSSNVGAAPIGMPKSVAASIMAKQPALTCEGVTDAYRVADKSIVARCSGGETYRIGALFGMGQRAMKCSDIAPLTQQRPC
jgi:hypothetical protein